MTSIKLAPLTIALALLAACGGGGGNDAPPPPGGTTAPTDAIPVGADRSAAGIVAYLLALAGDTPEHKEPLDVSRWAPVQSEEAEALPLPQ